LSFSGAAIYIEKRAKGDKLVFDLNCIIFALQNKTRTLYSFSLACSTQFNDRNILFSHSCCVLLAWITRSEEVSWIEFHVCP